MPRFTISDQKSRQAVINYVNRLPDNGKCFKVAITVQREKRSLPQNRLYRMWVSLIADETGNNADDLHEAFKMMFLGTKDFTIGETSAKAPISTTSLDTLQFTSFLERLEAWVTSELSILLPHPEDMFWAEFEQRYG
jgi:hypothetical protein